MVDTPVTLEEIEGEFWGEPPAEASRLVKTAHELRRKPVEQLAAEDLRLLLGQRAGVDTLLPYALDILEADPLAEGDYYPGDLLVAVLKLPVEQQHAQRVARIVAAATSMDLDARHAPVEVIETAIEAYRAS